MATRIRGFNTPPQGLKLLHSDREMLKTFSRTAAPNGTIFSMEYPWDKEIQDKVQLKFLGSQMATL